jgi:hypothetical protein
VAEENITHAPIKLHEQEIIACRCQPPKQEAAMIQTTIPTTPAAKVCESKEILPKFSAELMKMLAQLVTLR